MAQTFARVSQQTAGYKLMGGLERCGRCRFFLKNNLCARVIGDVSPSAWCRFFSMEARAAMDAGGGYGHGRGGIPTPPTQDASFMTALPAGFTYACASATTNLLWTDPAGTTITDYAINAPRFLANGLLCEGTRINRLLNSATPASHTTASVPLGSYAAWCNGSGSMALAAGTAVGTGFGTATQGNKLNIDITTAGTVVATVTGTLFAIQMELASAAEVYAPSSFIKTTGAAVTRAATVVSSGQPTGFNLAQCTYVVEYLPINAKASSARVMEMVGTIPANDWERISGASITSLRGWTGSGALSQSNITSGAAVNEGVVHKAGYTASVGSAIVSVDGAAAVSAGQALRPVDLINLYLMSNNTSTVPTFGYLRRFRYWPVAATATQLQQVTT